MDFGSISLEPTLWIKSGLRLAHFAGIILGVGSATLLDLIIFRFAMIRKIEETYIKVIDFASGVVTFGLVLLWTSGIGFFIYYYMYDQDKINNPKLLAKIIIVVVLTFNAFLIHGFVLPQIKIQIGQRLFTGLTRFHCFLLLTIGSISAISWYVPLVLGIVPQFNKTVPSTVILASYSLLVIMVNVMIQIALAIIGGRNDDDC